MTNWKEFAESFKLNETKLNEREIKDKLKDLIINSVKKIVPDEKFGIMFSGGVDSSTIALICKQLGCKFTCYVAGLDDKDMEEAQDLIWAKKVAKKYGFKLKVIKIKLGDVEKYIKKVVDVIKDTNVIKIGVGLPVYLCCEQAKKDKIKFLFSGLGSEEIFAGYDRHRKSSDINKECLNGLSIIEERDLSRDLPISKENNVELLTPFLDEELVEFSLRIPSKYKIKMGNVKYILREAAEEIGLDKEIAFRPKKAAQYGSKFDGGINKLAGKLSKTEYLSQFLPKLKLGCLVSGGKDSIYALYLMKKRGFDVKCLITMKSENEDSYMFHTPNVDLVKYQAESIGIPLFTGVTKGEKEIELLDLEKVLEQAKEKYGIEGITTGALYSDYQRERIEKICEKLNLKVFSPLWHIDQEKLLKDLIKDGFEVILVKIAAEGLNKSYLGKKIDEGMIKDLIKLNGRIGLNICGEGGEYESFVLNGPIFKKRIYIIKAKKNIWSENTGEYIIESIELK